MTKATLVMTPDVAKILADRLSQIDSVSQFDAPGERQSETIVHSLTDMEKSFREIVDNLLPRLINESDSEKLEDTLLDIGEELRHILYHITDPKYFSYLVPDSSSE